MGRNAAARIGDSKRVPRKSHVITRNSDRASETAAPQPIFVSALPIFVAPQPILVAPLPSAVARMCSAAEKTDSAAEQMGSAAELRPPGGTLAMTESWNPARPVLL